MLAFVAGVSRKSAISVMSGRRPCLSPNPTRQNPALNNSFLRSFRGRTPMDKVPALTGARAVAAYAVLFEHAIDWTYGVSSPATHEFCARLAYFGMSLFFCLSGFVISLNYRESLA